MNHFTIDSTKPRIRFSIKYEILDSWTLLLESMNYIVGFIYDGDKSDVDILKTLMQKNMIQNNLEHPKPLLSMLFEKKNICTIRIGLEDTPTIYESFQHMSITKFYILENRLYKYCFWNPFYGRKNKIGTYVTIGDYPGIVLLMYRINIVLNLIIRLQKHIEYKKSKKKKPTNNDYNYHQNSEYYANAINGSFNTIDASKFRSNDDFRKYFLLKKLKHFISAHITTMSMIESYIEQGPRDQNNNPRLALFLFNNINFYNAVMPKNIAYEYCPFDEEYVTIKRKKHEEPAHKLIACKYIKQYNVEETDKLLLNASYHDILKMDLDELANHMKIEIESHCCITKEKMEDEKTQPMGNNNDNILSMYVKEEILSHCIYFFPLTKEMLTMIQFGYTDILPQHLIQHESLSKMVYINEEIMKNRNDTMLFCARNNIQKKYYFSYPHILQYTLLWAWILKVNIIQHLLQLTHNIILKKCGKIYSFVKEFYEQYSSISDNDFQKIRDKMMGICDYEKKEESLQQLSYQLYIELHNMTPLGVAMFYYQRFSDADMLGYVEQRVVTNYYDIYYPHTDQTLLPGLSPNISPYLCSQHLDLKPKIRKEGTLRYSLHKVFPSKCEIRKIGSMLIKSANKNIHTSLFLFGTVWFSSMGLYRRSNHYIMSKDFTKLLNARKTLFFDITIDGKTLKQRRKLFFENQAKTKYVIHDMIREQRINYVLNYLPALKNHYKCIWRGFPYIEWNDYKLSSIININFAREFFSLTGFLPIGNEKLSTSDKHKIFILLNDENKRKLVIKNVLGKTHNGNETKIIIRQYNAIIESLKKLNKNDVTMKTLKKATELYSSLYRNELLMSMIKITLETNTKSINSNIRCLYWSYFLLIKRSQMEKSLYQYICSIYPSIGLSGTYYLLEKILKEKNNNDKGNKKRKKLIENSTFTRTQIKTKKKRDQQSRRISPLRDSGIYRLYKYGYVRSFIEVLKNLYVEILSCTLFFKDKFPYWLTYPYCDSLIKEKIDNYEHLGKLTVNWFNNYEKVFRFLYEKCSLSLSGFLLLLETVKQFMIKESNSKIIIQLRSLHYKDFRLLNYYFRKDHKKIRIQSIDDNITDFYSLFPKTAKNRKEWTNTTFVKPHIFKKRMGYDIQKYKVTKSPITNFVLSTKCCNRLTTSPCYIGSGNVKVAKMEELDDRDIFDEYIDNILCTCHLFEYNTIQCSVHDSLLSTSGKLVCCMFSKNDRKKKKNRYQRLLRQLKDIKTRIDMIPENDDSLLSFKSNAMDIFERTNEEIVKLGFKDIDVTKNNCEFVKLFVKAIQTDYMSTTRNTYIIDDNLLNTSEENTAIMSIIEEEQNSTFKKIGIKQEISDDESDDSDDDDSDDDMDDTNSDNFKKTKKKKTKKDIKMMLEKMTNGKKYIKFSDMMTDISVSFHGNESLIQEKKKRKTSSFYKIHVGNDLTNRVRKWGGRFIKFTTSYLCNIKEEKIVRKIKTFGNTLVCISTNENIQLYCWCSKCGSFVQQHSILYYGEQYMCENCWATKPEGCFYFYDNINSDHVIVTFDESIKICIDIANPTNNEERNQKSEIDRIIHKQLYKTDKELLQEERRKKRPIDTFQSVIQYDVDIIEDKHKNNLQQLLYQYIVSKKIGQIQGSFKRKKPLRRLKIIDTIVNIDDERRNLEEIKTLKNKETEIRDAYKSLDAEHNKRKQKPKKTADLVKTSLLLRKEVMKRKMRQFYVVDNIHDDNTIIKIIQTDKKKWPYGGYFGGKGHVFIRSRIEKYNAKKKKQKMFRNIKYS